MSEYRLAIFENDPIQEKFCPFAGGKGALQRRPRLGWSCVCACRVGSGSGSEMAESRIEEPNTWVSGVGDARNSQFKVVARLARVQQ